MIDKAYIALNRLLVNTWMLKVLLVRAQKEQRNILLEARWKLILVTQWQKVIWIVSNACVGSRMCNWWTWLFSWDFQVKHWKYGLVSSWADSKIQEEREKLRKELLGIKEAALDDSGNFEPIQIVKDAKIGGDSLWGWCAVEIKPTVWLDNLCAGEIRH